MGMVVIEQNVTDFFNGHQDRFFFIVMVFDLMYPIVAMVQAKMMGAYPGRRFRQTFADATSIYAHIITGFLSIYGLSGVFLAERYGPENCMDDAKPFVQFMGVCMLIHSITSFYMLPIVHGEKIITQPLYAGQICINTVDAINAIRDPTFNNAMLLYGAVNAFVFVRMFYMTLVAYTYIDRKLLYTFAITASFISPVLSGHDMMWLTMYGFPAIYGVIVFIYRSIPRAETFANMRENLMQTPDGGKKRIDVPTPPPTAMVYDIGEDLGSDINTAPGGDPAEQSPWAPHDRIGDDTDSILSNQPVVTAQKPPGAGIYDGPNHYGPRPIFGKPATRCTLGAAIFFGMMTIAFMVSTITLAIKDVEDGKCRGDYSDLTTKDPVDFIGIANNMSETDRVARAQALAANQVLYQFHPRNLTAFANKQGKTFLFGGAGGPVGMAMRELDKQKFFVEELLPHQLVYIEPAVNATLMNIPKLKFDKLTDYDQLFQFGFPMPKQDANGILNDDQFAYEQTTITAGYIEKCYYMPKLMQGKLTEEQVKNLLPPNVVSLADAMSKGLVYQTDLSFIDVIGHHNQTANLLLTPNLGPRTKYTIGTLGLFIAHNETDKNDPKKFIRSKLKPLAIWLGSGSEQVFTPNDHDVEWVVAKLYFANGAKTVSHVKHVVINHFLQEPQLIASFRQLPDTHPVNRLLAYHGHLGIGIAEFIQTSFMLPTPNQAFSVDQVLGVGGDGLARLASREFEIFNYEDHDPEQYYKLRDVHGLPNHHYRDDNLGLFYIIEKFVENYLSIYYPDDATVKNDFELQQWSQEVASMQYGRVKGFPARIDTFKKLVRILARYCWRNTVHHSSNSGENAYEYLAHPGAMVSSLYMAPPKEKGQVSWEDLKKALPYPEESVYKMGVLRNLKRYMKPDHGMLRAYEAAGLGVRAERFVRQYQQEMKTFSVQVKERMRKQKEEGWIPGPPYGLDPEHIPYWGWL